MSDVVQLGVTKLTRRQQEVIAAAVREGLDGVRIPEPLSGSEWADQHFYLSAESSGIEGPWQCLPLQRDILDCITNDDIRIVDWEKCARIGYTKILDAAACYFVSHKKRTGAIMQPTDGDAQKFGRAEIDTAIRDCPAVGAEFRGTPGKRGPYNKIDEKWFNGAVLYILGGKSEKNYRSRTADFWFYDELEAFDPDPGGSGSPTAQGDGRITNSPFPKSVRGSTPRRLAGSLLKPEVETAKHKFRRYWHCPECGTPQVLVWAQMRWDKGKPETARYQCEHCVATWVFADVAELDAGGFWGTDDGYRIGPGCRLLDPDGELADWPRHIAFHCWVAYSPFFSWVELVEEWLEATAQLKRGDNRALVTFTNIRLAEYWEDAGEQVDHDELHERARRATYTRPPKDVLLLTAQVDVQANRLELEIMGHGRGAESWGIEYRVIDGDPESLEVWVDLEAVIGQAFETADGRKLPIAAVAIDSGFLPDRVYQFRRTTSHPRVYCVKGWGGMDKPISTAPQQRKSGRSSAPVPLYMMGSDTCKSLVLKRLQVTEPGPGYCHFPPTYGEDYFRALTAERRVTRYRRGFEVIEFEKVRPRNEALDIRAMGIFAIEVLNPVWDALDPDNVPPPPPPEEQRPVIPHAQRRPMRYRKR